MRASSRPAACCRPPLPDRSLAAVVGTAIIESSRRFESPRLALGGRPTVGHVALDHGIGVRIPASQPITPSQPIVYGPSLGVRHVRHSTLFAVLDRSTNPT